MNAAKPHLDSKSLPEREVTSRVKSIASSFVEPRILSNDASLIENGLDSLGAMALASRLSKEFGIHLPSTLLFNYPSIQDISGYLRSFSETKRTPSSTNDLERTLKLNLSVKMDSIAVIGMSCRFPNDINTLDDMWSMQIRKAILPNVIPPSRWDSDAAIADMHPCSDKYQSIRFGSLLSSAVMESFCSDLFNFSSFEAEVMDPAQRLAIEVGYEALVDAGLTAEGLSTSEMGVFVGALGLTPSSHLPCNAMPNTSSVYDATRAALSVVAGRISFELGLQGPCFTIDSACSSSLVALHSAWQSLLLGECKAALVVGVNILSSTLSIPFATAGMLSPSGHCYTFDERADGYCRAEGCGAIVLQKLTSVNSEKRVGILNSNWVCRSTRWEES